MKPKKIIISLGIAFILFGLVVWGRVASKRDTVPSTGPLLGQVLPNEARNHVPDGTQVTYDSNPPAGGPHYAETAHVGIYGRAPSDGYLVHSLEHGAVIIWYQPGLSEAEIKQLKNIYDSVPVNKKIMVPRESLNVPVALSSWGRVLKLSSINESEIKEFMETNYDRAPEQESI